MGIQVFADRSDAWCREVWGWSSALLIFGAEMGLLPFPGFLQYGKNPERFHQNGA